VVVGLGSFAGLGAIKRRMHVALAAGDDDAVDALEEGVEVDSPRQGRDDQRDAADAGHHRVQIGLHRSVTEVTVVGSDIGGDDDDGNLLIGVHVRIDAARAWLCKGRAIGRLP
jgi:hypothetical protein